jgi:N-acetyl-anhydromuramyl-L-alanine amidase AmpD
MCYFQTYLRTYGYLSEAETLPERIREAVTAFQTVAGLENRDGQLSAETLREMRKPRCGNVDINRRPIERRKRFGI